MLSADVKGCTPLVMCTQLDIICSLRVIFIMVGDKVFMSLLRCTEFSQKRPHHKTLRWREGTAYCPSTAALCTGCPTATLWALCTKPSYTEKPSLSSERKATGRRQAGQNLPPRREEDTPHLEEMSPWLQDQVGGEAQDMWKKFMWKSHLFRIISRRRPPGSVDVLGFHTALHKSSFSFFLALGTVVFA